MSDLLSLRRQALLDLREMRARVEEASRLPVSLIERPALVRMIRARNGAAEAWLVRFVSNVAAYSAALHLPEPDPSLASSASREGA